MLKKLKLTTVITLVLALCLCNTTAFAAEDSNTSIPEGATRHEIQLTLLPEGYEEGNASVGGNTAVQPFVWGNTGMDLIYHHTASTASFYLSDRYFAYEVEALPVDDVPTTQEYTVDFKYVGAGIKASITGEADGTNYKFDWITINVDGNYYFEVTNNTDYILAIDITYYSWN